MTPSTEITTASPPLSIPLPADRPPAAARDTGGARLGPFLVILLTGLAFLLASFPARNSDVWLHLARGRLLAHGQIPATTDPDLAFDLWGNQTWIYDLCCYGCYAVLGGPGLVLAKALLAAGIALLLVWQSRSTSGWYLPAICTGLAILTMGKYLALLPATVSYFFFALALAFLRPKSSTEDEVAPPLVSWRLVLLFLVWANVDRWFLLGLGVVALVWLGEILDVSFAAGASSQRWQTLLLRRGVSLAALVAVCLLNPSFLDAFVLVDDLRGLGVSAAQTVSPFESAYFTTVGWNPASLAYFFLLGLSLISFLAALPQLRWRRLLPWLGLALLSALQLRTIPFFAIVAGPVLAWNLRDALARHFQKARGPMLPSELVRLGGALTALLLLTLLVCAWPGWLQSPPYGHRRWAFDLPPSLERVAATVRRWHEEGKLSPNGGGGHLSFESVKAFAWFCPEEKRVRLKLPDSLDELPGSPDEWRRQMREKGVDHILVYDSDRDRVALVLGGLVTDPEQWPLLYKEGDLAVFGWRDPERPESAAIFRGRELDLDRLAFHPAEDKKAPAKAFDPQESGRAWFEAFWKPAPPRSIDRDEARMHLLHAEALQREAPVRHMIRWLNSEAAGFVAAANAWTFPNAFGDAPLRLALFGLSRPGDDARSAPPTPMDRMVSELQRRYTFQRDDAPPALYYLAVRAARRAVAADPDDAPAHLVLGKSYLGLLAATRERVWSAQFPQLVKLRQAQAITALQRVLELRPDFPEAHLHLAQLYHQMNYFDLALKHLQAYYRLFREAGPPRGMDREEFLKLQAQHAENIERLTREVQRLESSVALRAEDSAPSQRARLAFENGLAGKALDLLLESDRSAFGEEGTKLELELLLNVGRARDVLEWLEPEHEQSLGPLIYHWVRVRALAATGDYLHAEEECDEAARAIALDPNDPQPVPLREKIAEMIAQLFLDGSRSQGLSASVFFARVSREMLQKGIQERLQKLRNQADLTSLHGLLALEEGETAEAESAFRSALGLRKGQSAKDADNVWIFNARILAQDGLNWLE